MAQGAVGGIEEGAGGKQLPKQGQEEETNFLSNVSEVKRTESKLTSSSGDARAGVIEAGAGGKEDSVRTASEGGDGEVFYLSPLKADTELSPSGRRSPFHDEVVEGVELVSDFADGDGEHNWDTIPNEPASPALRGVHRIAVEVMRRSFGSADGNPGTYRGWSWYCTRGGLHQTAVWTSEV